MEHSDIVFIINPNSGKKSTETFIKNLQQNYPKVKYKITNDLEDFDNFMNKNIEKYKLFVIVGGDGSVSSAAKHLAGRSDKVFAVYPKGSGNGFARELGYKANLKSLFSAINKMNVRPIDVLEVNNELCINALGVGFDAAVAHAFAKLKKRGFWSYLKLVMRLGFRFPTFEVNVGHADKILKTNCMMLSIANTRQFGNNAIIAPFAKPDDGLLDIAILKKCCKIRYVFFAIKLMTGTLRPSKCYESLQTEDELILTSKFKQFHIDGDPRKFQDFLTVKISDKKLYTLKCN